MSVEPPVWIGDLLGSFVVEELVSVLRHDLRNRLAAVRNARFFLRRKVEVGAPELYAVPRVTQMFGLIESELDGAEALLEAKHTAPVPGARSDVAAVVLRLVGELVVPPTVRLGVEVGPAAVAAVDGTELALATFCLIANAVEAVAAAGTGQVRVACGEQGGQASVEVIDDGPGLPSGNHERALEPRFSTKPGRLGLGLNIARRVVGRARGGLQLDAAEPGVRARLWFPSAP